MQKPTAEGKNVEKRGKKGKIWIKWPRYRVELHKMQMPLAEVRKREQKGEKDARKTEQKREEKKKKGVMY